MNTPSRWDPVDTDAYDKQWARLAERGKDPHGEVAFIQRYEPASVLDGGCGTGRVAIELHNREIATVGADLDPGMIEAARTKAPHIDWHVADLSALDLPGPDGAARQFDVVALPGNVMIFVAPGTEAVVVGRCAAHLRDGGRLIAGFQLGRGLSVEQYDAAAAAAGLSLEDRFATWDGDPWVADGASYAVSVHRK